MNTIKTELESIRGKYDGTITLVNGLTFSQKERIRMIEFYSNSKYLDGQRDELDLYKPFFQILNAVCDVENTAKDLDTKDISITSDDGNHYLESFMLSKDIQVWMKTANFAKTLNDMRDTHTRYGSLLVKKCMKKDKNGKKKLYIELPEWKNVITDQVDILGGAIVEVHYMTIMDLMKMTEWKNLDIIREKLQNETGNKRIPVYEIRGEFPRSFIKEVDSEYSNKKINITDKDKQEFSYQLYYIAGNPVESGQTMDFVDTLCPLYWEDDTERVYKYLKRKPKSGRDFGVGVFEEGEEAQIWTNDAVLKQHRAMEYTSKVIGQSASKKLKGRNMLTEVDNGVILEHEDGKPIEALNLLPSGGLAQYNNLIVQWYNQLEKTTSAYAAQRGETPPSGTPFRLQATILQQSSSVFKTLQQEMGIFITEIFEDWIMPYLATKLNKEHILSYDFSPEELKEIDANFSARKANEEAKKKILSGQIVTPEEFDAWLSGADDFIKQTKGKRFIEIPKNFYKDLDAKVTVNITGEQKNKAATLESLSNILITVASNPAITQDPVLSQVLMKILELSGAGISPISLAGAISDKQKMQQQMPQQPQQGQQQQASLQANPAPQTA